MTYLYGLTHSNKDFESGDAFGKNTFTTAFPIALANYLACEKNLPMNYIVADLGEGDTGYAITAATPFYGEGGGQAGDMGTLASLTGEARVITTHKPAPTLLVHEIEVTNGELHKGGEATLKHFHRQGDAVMLLADNAAVCPPMIFTGLQLEELHIEGRAVGLCRGL